MCRRVHEKVRKSKRQNGLSCIMALLESERESKPSPSLDWIQKIDRGSLWHVKEGTYMLFYAMEEEVRHHIRMTKASQMSDGYRQEVVESIVSNNDLAFHWCMLSAETSNSDAETVLQRLVETWTTV